MVAQHDPELLRGAARRQRAERSRRQAARVGAQPARRGAARPRLRARADGPLLRAAPRSAGTACGCTAATTPAGARPARGARSSSAIPGIEIAAGWSPPHRPLTEAEEQEVAARINADRPDVVWVGHRRAEAGEVDGAHAPAARGARAGRRRRRVRLPRRAQAAGAAWMQRRGLEWLFRLSQEPLPAARALPALQPGVRGGLRAPVPARTPSAVRRSL